MTDKQIIIDGVNVSEWTDAEVYYKLQHYSPKATKQIAFDLYKQLKAKEQECEELKEARKNSRCAWKSLEGTLCPEAQQQLDQLKAENKHLNDLLNQALKELEKTRETLTEIKKIAEKCCIMQAILDCENYDDCTQCGRTSDGEGIQQILQKISEVIE